MTRPDFFISSSDDVKLSGVYACTRIARVRSDARDDFMLIEVEPPLPFFGDGLRQVVIACRSRQESLFPISDWPMHVHVVIPPHEVMANHGHVMQSHAMQVAAWAELYRTEEDARAKRMTQ